MADGWNMGPNDVERGMRALWPHAFPDETYDEMLDTIADRDFGAADAREKCRQAVIDVLEATGITING